MSGYLKDSKNKFSFTQIFFFQPSGLLSWIFLVGTLSRLYFCKKNSVDLLQMKFTSLPVLTLLYRPLLFVEIANRLRIIALTNDGNFYVVNKA